MFVACLFFGKTLDPDVSSYLSGVVALEVMGSGCPKPSCCLFLKELDLELSP